MSRKHQLASDKLKYWAAQQAGFGDKIRKKGWESASSGELGAMVTEIVRLGQEEVLRGYRVAQEHGLTNQFLAQDGWRSFSPRDMFRYAEALYYQKEMDQAKTGSNHPSID